MTFGISEKFENIIYRDAITYIVTIKGTDTQDGRDKLGTIIESSKVTVVSDKAPTVTARVFAKKTDENSEIGQAI